MSKEIAQLGLELGYKGLYQVLLLNNGEEREKAHNNSLALFKIIQETKSDQLLTPFYSLKDQEHKLRQTVFGVTFDNPLGIAAGLDKNGQGTNIFGRIGFGHVEIGTVTPRPQYGKPKQGEDGNLFPRIRHLPDGQYLNRLGFPSLGMRKVKDNILKYGIDRGLRVGVSIGPNAEDVSPEKAMKACSNAAEFFARHLYYGSLTEKPPQDRISYLAVNISSPNTDKLRDLHSHLKELLTAVKEGADLPRILIKDTFNRPKTKIPILVKISPDLELKQVEEILKVTKETNCEGIIIGNTTLNHKYEGQGGLSGKALTEHTLHLSRFAYEQTSGGLAIVRAGGVYDTKTAWEAITFGGASLVQMLTALVHQDTSSPSIAYRINKGLLKKVEQHGLKNISEARGNNLD